MAETIKVGDLRWRCILSTQMQSPDPDSTGIVLDYVDERPVYADIRPLGSIAWRDGVQIDMNAITHRIFVRWRDDLDMYSYLFRDRRRPDGTTRRERFRIHRRSEWQGRQRFTLLDAEYLGDG